MIYIKKLSSSQQNKKNLIRKRDGEVLDDVIKSEITVLTFFYFILVLVALVIFFFRENINYRIF